MSFLATSAVHILEPIAEKQGHDLQHNFSHTTEYHLQPESIDQFHRANAILSLAKTKEAMQSRITATLRDNTTQLMRQSSAARIKAHKATDPSFKGVMSSAAVELTEAKNKQARLTRAAWNNLRKTTDKRVEAQTEVDSLTAGLV